jgi:hypothetical protein
MLTYMAQMGGWGVLDYALHYTANAAPYLRLGYASILSAWALMNTGTPQSNYGYWYPGRANDGGAGGGFEPAAFGQTWLEQPHHRGSWYYACEIDLGFCGALRAAATILADDPIFGRICLGGDSHQSGGQLAVIPKDGVRRRFHARLAGGRFDLVTPVEHFAAGRPIVFTEAGTQIEFPLETSNPRAHTAEVRVAGLPAGAYQVRVGPREVTTFSVRGGTEVRLELPFAAGGKVQAFNLERTGEPQQ